MSSPYQRINHLLPILILLLSGCSPILNPYHENFRCRTPDSEGRCVDTTTAYVEARHSGANTAVQNTSDSHDCNGKYATTKPSDNLQDFQKARYQLLTDFLRKVRKPLLQPPKILSVLMLPYQGAKGELFMTRYAYIQVEDAKWILTDQHEKKMP